MSNQSLQHLTFIEPRRTSVSVYIYVRKNPLSSWIYAKADEHLFRDTFTINVTCNIPQLTCLKHDYAVIQRFKLPSNAQLSCLHISQAKVELDEYERFANEWREQLCEKFASALKSDKQDDEKMASAVCEYWARLNILAGVILCVWGWIFYLVHLLAILHLTHLA